MFVFAKLLVGVLAVEAAELVVLGSVDTENQQRHVIVLLDTAHEPVNIVEDTLQY